MNTQYAPSPWTTLHGPPAKKTTQPNRVDVLLPAAALAHPPSRRGRDGTTGAAAGQCAAAGRRNEVPAVAVRRREHGLLVRGQRRGAQGRGVCHGHASVAHAVVKVALATLCAALHHPNLQLCAKQLVGLLAALQLPFQPLAIILWARHAGSTRERVGVRVGRRERKHKGKQ